MFVLESVGDGGSANMVVNTSFSSSFSEYEADFFLIKAKNLIGLKTFQSHLVSECIRQPSPETSLNP